MMRASGRKWLGPTVIAFVLGVAAGAPGHVPDAVEIAQLPEFQNPSLAGSWNNVTNKATVSTMNVRQVGTGSRLTGTIDDGRWMIVGEVRGQSVELTRCIPISELEAVPEKIRSQTEKTLGIPDSPGFLAGRISLKYDRQTDELVGEYVILVPRLSDTGLVVAIDQRPLAVRFRRPGAAPVVGPIKTAPTPPPPTQSLQQAISRATNAVEGASDKPRAAKLEAMRQAVEVLAPHGEDDHDVAIGVAMIDLERDRQEMLDDNLEHHIDKILGAVDESTRTRAWRELRQEVLERSTHFMRLLASHEIGVEDARRLLEIAKYGSQAIDDFRDISPQGGATSRITRFLNYAHAVAAVAEGVQNQDARKIMAGLRGSIGAMEMKIAALGVSMPSPVAAIVDVPGEVAAAMIDVTHEGFDQATETMVHIDGAVGGDEAAAARAVESARRIEQTLSSENYGRAMASALTDRIIDKIPFVRTISAWFQASDQVGPLDMSGWLGRWSTKRGPINIRQEGALVMVDLEPGGVLTRYGGKIEVLLANATQIHGTWSTEFQKGTFTWKLDGRTFDGLYSNAVGEPETRGWDGSKE